MHGNYTRDVSADTLPPMRLPVKVNVCNKLEITRHHGTDLAFPPARKGGHL